MKKSTYLKSRNGHRSGPLSLLLVEDNPGDARLVRELMAASHLHEATVQVVPRLADALSVLDEDAPDLILLDLTLPDNEGLTGLSRLLTAAADVPVIVLTGLSDFDVAAEAVGMGAQDFLVKGSFDGALLQRAVTYACERMEHIRALERAREEARRNEQRYRAVAETVSDVVYEATMSPDGIPAVNWITDSVHTITGFTPDELNGPGAWRNLVHPEDLPAALEHLRTVLEGKPVTSRFRFRTRAGETGWAESTKIPLVDADDVVVGIRAAVKDITQQVEAEAALRKSEKLHRVTLKHISDAVFVTDDRGRFTYVCPNVQAIFGYDRDDILALGNITAVLGDDMIDLPQLDTCEELTNIERTVHDRDGGAHAVLVNVKRVEIQGGTRLYTCRDITDRKEAESAQRQSEARFQALFESMTQGVVFHDLDGTIFAANRAAEKMLGLSLAQMQGRDSMDPTWQAIDADGRPFPGEEHPAMRALREGEIVQGIEMGVRHAGTDEYRWLLVDAVPQFRDGEDAPYQVYALFSDVTERRHTTEALQQSRDELARKQRQLQALFDNALDAILLADDDGCYVDANPAACELLGYSREELREMCIADITPPPELVKESLLRQEFLQQGKQAGEFVLQCKDGETRVVEYRAAANILPGLHLSILRDATERLRTEQEHRRLAAIVASTNDAVVGTDLNGIITTWNAAAERIFGYSSAEAVGRPVEMLVPEDRRDELHAINRTARSGENMERIETVRRRSDGSLIDISLNVSPIFDARGEVIGSAGIEHDISERKRHEREIVAAKEKAEEMSRLKDAFLANMSHEIRTPLTSILGLTEVLHDEVDGETREFIGLIRQAGERLMDTLNSVLELSQLQGGTLELPVEPVDLLAEARGLLDLFRPQADERGLRLKLELLTSRPLVAEANRTAVGRVLSNLVSNALKFTCEGSVTLRLDTDEDEVTVEVADTGIGMSEDFLPHVFDEFRQESSGDARSHEGNGLGTAIAKQLVELFGGRIQVRSREGEGTTFTVTLPASTGTAPDVPSVETRIGLPAGARILSVDDDANATWIVQRLLGDYDVHEADGGAAALALARARDYDAVLLDINLGGGDSGEDVLRALRRLPGYARTPVVALTAYAMPGDEERFLAAGFDGYLSKPFDRPRLTACLKRAVQAAAAAADRPD